MTVVLLFALCVPATAQQTALLRLAHFSPDAPRLDLVLDGTILARDLSFTEVTSYLTVSAGEHEIRVYPHRPPHPGGNAITPWDQAQPTPMTPFTLNADFASAETYTLVIVGFYNPKPAGNETGSLAIHVTPDTRVSVTGPAGFSEVGTGNLDLTNLAPGIYTVVASRDDAAPIEQTIEVLANIQLTLPISLQAANGDAIAPAPEPQPTAINPEWRNTQLQLYRDSQEVTELAAESDRQTTLRFIHASPVTPALELQLEAAGTKTPRDLGALSFPNATAYTAVAAGKYRLSIQEQGNNRMVGELHNLPLEPGLRYTVYIIGSERDSYVALIPAVDARE